MVTVAKAVLLARAVRNFAEQSEISALAAHGFHLCSHGRNYRLCRGLLLLASYALLLTRLIADARRSRDRTGMLVIMGSSAGLSFRFSSRRMAVGMLPVMGVPLP